MTQILFIILLITFVILSVVITIVALVNVLTIPYDFFTSKKGPFYAPSLFNRTKHMLKLAGELNNKKVVDLGSGDGRLVRLFAKHGAIADGLELNPILIMYSKIINFITRSKNVKILKKDFFTTDLSDYDIVVIYGLGWVLKNLETKLQKELKPGSIVISNMFKFPNWKIDESLGKVHRYIVK